eukprot:6490322-Amphidinium_carterae.3
MSSLLFYCVVNPIAALAIEVRFNYDEMFSDVLATTIALVMPLLLYPIGCRCEVLDCHCHCL